MSDIQLNRHEGGIAELVLNRGPVNALSALFLLDFAGILAELAADDDVRAIVLSSSFKVFSAGLDLKEAQGFDIPAQHAIVKGLNEGFLALFACPKPTVCAVNGAAIAGGLFFVLGSDLRVVSSKARLGLAEVRVGASFPVGPMEIARATLSPDMLRRLMLTGQPIDAATAHASGIADVLDEDPRARALTEARALAQIPPGTYAMIKRQIRGMTIALIEAGIAAGGNTPEGGWFNAETRSAMQAMIG
ncbi:enoyl-CoA hydratase/isomerase family protein [Ruegeria marina]|uniref:Enoyl-CoA hydratase/carnithine racemase n=1 Tax=Ruegeria marina TaxID=639004 RepID=A0A1G6IMA3_9RHOB|nr:enoyl-CoA hydratase/isomerase family protein [Ruegeria marina]SDC07560.1 Enoyl-CoA hydratase/carnithine racemase [Ruegeria marina]